MKTVYEAEDGTIFQNEADCIEYEANDFLKYYNENGLTANFDSAFIVELLNEYSIIKFYALCENNCIACDAFNPGDSGIYIWNSNDSKFEMLSQPVANSLKKFFKNNDQERVKYPY